MLGDTPELERSSVELAASAQLHEVDVPSPAEGLLFPPNFLPDHLGMFLDLISYCYENGITSSPPPQPASQQQPQPASNASSVENLWRHLCVRLLRQAENSKLSREHFVQLLSFPCVGTLPTAARSKLLAIVLELLPSVRSSGGVGVRGTLFLTMSPRFLSLSLSIDRACFVMASTTSRLMARASRRSCTWPSNGSRRARVRPSQRISSGRELGAPVPIRFSSS